MDKRPVLWLLTATSNVWDSPSGTVNLATIYYGGWNSSGYNCSGLSSLKEVQDCMLAMHDKWLADDLSGLNSNPNNLPPEPLSCPTAVLTDSAHQAHTLTFSISPTIGAELTPPDGLVVPLTTKFAMGRR